MSEASNPTIPLHEASKWLHVRNRRRRYLHLQHRMVDWMPRHGVCLARCAQVEVGTQSMEALVEVIQQRPAVQVAKPSHLVSNTIDGLSAPIASRWMSWGAPICPSGGEGVCYGQAVLDKRVGARVRREWVCFTVLADYYSCAVWMSALENADE